MKTTIYTKFQAFLMLFVLMLSSVGLPIIAHECSHEKVKDVHIYSSDSHSCISTCCKTNTSAKNTICVEKEPCCTFETTLFISEVLMIVKNNIEAKNFFDYSNFENLIVEKENQQVAIEKVYQDYFQKFYGYQYRIRLQSFLC